MTANKFCGGLLAANNRSILEHRVVGFKDVIPCDSADYARLHQFLGQVPLPDVVVICQQHFHEFWGCNQPPLSIVRHAQTGLRSLCCQYLLVCSAVRAGGLCGCNGNACGFFQSTDAFRIHGQPQRVTSTVQPFCSDTVRNALCIETINHFIDRFICINVNVKVGGRAGRDGGTLLLVVLLHLYFGVPNWNFDLSSLRISFITWVENEIVLGDECRTQLFIYQTRIPFLCNMWHKIFLLVTVSDLGSSCKIPFPHRKAWLVGCRKSQRLPVPADLVQRHPRGMSGTHSRCRHRR